MNTEKIKLKAIDGTIKEAILVSLIKINEKNIVLYTLNETDHNGLVKIYVSNYDPNGTLTRVEDIDWPLITNAMRAIISASQGEFSYVENFIDGQELGTDGIFYRAIAVQEVAKNALISDYMNKRPKPLTHKEQINAQIYPTGNTPMEGTEVVPGIEVVDSKIQAVINNDQELKPSDTVFVDGQAKVEDQTYTIEKPVPINDEKEQSNEEANINANDVIENGLPVASSNIAPSVEPVMDIQSQPVEKSIVEDNKTFSSESENTSKSQNNEGSLNINDSELINALVKAIQPIVLQYIQNNLQNQNSAEIEKLRKENAELKARNEKYNTVLSQLVNNNNLTR